MSDTFANARARHLSFAKDNSAYNRAWFEEVRARVLAGEPFAYVNADVPTEIFKAMDIPVVVNQWWSSVISAKQKSGAYLERLNGEGYRENLCKYCSLGYAATFETDPNAAPWGGLPAPTLFVTGNDCNGSQKIFRLWADKFDAPLFVIERAAAGPPQGADWLARVRTDWEAIFGADVIDALVAQYQDLIEFLERHTGRRLDETKLARALDLVNEQEEYYARTRDLIARTIPAPLNIADQMPATMIPQWHRGGEWARDRAKLFYEETLARVESGAGAAPNERLRLMWLGTGLWYNLGFYEHFEREFGAVFVWSIYLAIAADAYATYGEDPLRVLAGRMTKIHNMLQTPPYNTQWYEREARAARIDGVVSLAGGTEDDCRETFGHHFLIRRAFEKAGVPVLRLGVDNADARTWDDASIIARVTRFIEDEVGPAKRAREGG
jgi:benzoyl-CoA reductase/2-hydroxyglutaryl-CoA dehydratase subunit BcrC/BadD/HgdB